MGRQKHEYKRPAAGCLPCNDLWDGDGNTAPFVSPEYKAMETKGIPLAGKITLDQYDRLVRLGYDGNVVMRWTQYHAAQELAKRSPHCCSPPAAQPRPFVVKPVAQSQSRPQAVRLRGGHNPDGLPVCPHCRSPVRADRLTQHIARVHAGHRGQPIR